MANEMSLESILRTGKQSMDTVIADLNQSIAKQKQQVSGLQMFMAGVEALIQQKEALEQQLVVVTKERDALKEAKPDAQA